MYSRCFTLWRWMSTAVFLYGSCLLAAPASRADPDSGAALAVYGTCTDQVRNGSFESGNLLYWSTSGSPTVISTGGHSGWHSALLGGRNYATDEIFQVLPCPYQGAYVAMPFCIYMSTTDYVAGSDHIEISMMNDLGVGGTSYYWNDYPADVWWCGTGSSSGSRACEPGMTWTVRVKAVTDYALPTTFLVDDVSLEVCCPDDAYEPNDSFGGADAVSPGTYDVWLCPNGDEDWFQFDAVSGRTIAASLTAGAPAQLDLCLFRPDGTLSVCSTNPSPTAPEYIETIADQTGSWRVQVYDLGGGTSTSASQLEIQVYAQAGPTSTPSPTSTATATRRPTPTTTPPGWVRHDLCLPVVLRKLWQP
jgi:hypothetical protein